MITNQEHIERLMRCGFGYAKDMVIDSFEKAYLRALLSRHKGNVTKAAVDAGMARQALQRLMRKHEMRSGDFKDKEVGSDGNKIDA